MYAATTCGRCAATSGVGPQFGDRALPASPNHHRDRINLTSRRAATRGLNSRPSSLAATRPWSVRRLGQICARAGNASAASGILVNSSERTRHDGPAQWLVCLSADKIALVNKLIRQLADQQPLRGKPILEIRRQRSPTLAPLPPPLH